MTNTNLVLQLFNTNVRLIKLDLNNCEQFDCIIVAFTNGKHLCHWLELVLTAWCQTNVTNLHVGCYFYVNAQDKSL